MRGYTLFELLVVFLIVGAVLAIAVPTLGPTSSKTQIESDVRAFAAFLRETRSEAIVRNREVVVAVSTETKTYATQNPQRTGRFSDDLTLSMTAAKTEQVDETTGGFRFFPDGSSTGGEIRVDSETADFVVTIEWLTGRVAVSAN